MSSNKLQLIYTALDSHQFSRAIKLCLALPPSYLIGRALLAHAYAKSGQRLKALMTLQGLLGTDGFPELQSEIKYALERRQEVAAHNAAAALAAESAASTNNAAALPNRKGGKKGKKKPAAKAPPHASQQQPQPNTTAITTNTEFDDFDWIDQLDTPPSLPDNWEECLPTDASAREPPDHTLLPTLCSTLTSLRLHLTAYQMFTWATASRQADDVDLLRQTFVLGLTVWMAPQYQALCGKILAQLQVTALQVARLQQETMSTGTTAVSPGTAWAAQTSLWQIEHLRQHGSSDSSSGVDEKRAAMLPRLAESLAFKAATGQQQAAHHPVDETNNHHISETENFMLYLRALDVQNKWDEKLEAIDARLADAARTNPRDAVLRELKATCLVALGRSGGDDSAKTTVRREMAQLLRLHPDNWNYWQLHLQNDSVESDLAESLALTTELLEQSKDDIYPLRAPYLARIERHLLILNAKTSATATEAQSLAPLVREVMDYGNRFCQRSSCTFADLLSYLRHILNNGTPEDVQSLVTWVHSVRSPPNAEDPKERRNQLRGYIFGVQVSYILASCEAVMAHSEGFAPPAWTEILQVWKEFQAFENPNQAQKENRAGDDLILLTIQQLTTTSRNKQNLVRAAGILEAGMQYSPHNAYLKIAAMFVYGHLNSVGRSFDLFRQIYIKHIQHESCAYLILPFLHAGACYQDAISVCQEILRLQNAAIRDASEFTGRAMECGTLEKANEFIKFQRERMNKSLTTLEAKGLTLDCAPMFRFEESGGQAELGALHGVIGGPEDIGRVHQMIAEAHNPHAAFSLLRLKEKSVRDHVEYFTENRDLEILSSINICRHSQSGDENSIFVAASREQILGESIRRCHHHSLLIRASLCLDATKAPKRGKIVKSSPELSKRCSSLLACVHDAQDFLQSSRDDPSFQQSDMTRSALVTMLHLCRAILAVSGGVTAIADESNNNGNGATHEVVDKLEPREQAATDHLLNSVASVKEGSAAFSALQQTETSDDPVPVICRFISDCLVPQFALFQMCASALELYGWGKRKRATRTSAGALASLAVELRDLVAAMNSCLEATLPMTLDDSLLLKDLGKWVEEDTVTDTVKSIIETQLETKNRASMILSKVSKTLDGFDIQV